MARNNARFNWNLAWALPTCEEAAAEADRVYGWMGAYAVEDLVRECVALSLVRHKHYQVGAGVKYSRWLGRVCRNHLRNLFDQARTGRQRAAAAGGRAVTGRRRAWESETAIIRGVLESVQGRKLLRQFQEKYGAHGTEPGGRPNPRRRGSKKHLAAGDGVAEALPSGAPGASADDPDAPELGDGGAAVGNAGAGDAASLAPRLPAGEELLDDDGGDPTDSRGPEPAFALATSGFALVGELDAQYLG